MMGQDSQGEAALHWSKTRQSFRYAIFLGLMLIKIFKTRDGLKKISSKFSLYYAVKEFEG